MKKLTIFLFTVFLIVIPQMGLAQQDTVAVADSDSVGVVQEKVGAGISQIEELFSASKILAIVVLLIATFLLNRLLVFLLGRFAENQASYRLLIKRIIPFLNVALWSFAIYFIISGIIDPPLETLLAVGASVGIAVGFAAQDVLKNIFGGFIIILDSPFQVGDKIEIDNHYGEVKEIGLRSTRVVTPDDSLITIPNADVVNNSVSNSNTSALFCQVVTPIYLPVDVRLEEVKEIAYKAAVSSRYVYMKKPVVVLVENKVLDRNFVVEVKVKAYVLDIRYEFLLKSEITELILTELYKRELIPGNQKTVTEIKEA